MPTLAPNPTRMVEILMVEDNPTDVFLTKEALRHSRFAVEINVAKDGEEALDYLHRSGRFSHAIEPDLVLLDLTLPKKSGWTILNEIKRNSLLSRTPVVILTGSKSEGDLKLAKEMRADLFIVKPADMSSFPVLINALDHILLNRFQRDIMES